MEMLATVFQGLLDLGAAVFLPIVLFIIGLIVGMNLQGVLIRIDLTVLHLLVSIY